VQSSADEIEIKFGDEKNGIWLTLKFLQPNWRGKNIWQAIMDFLKVFYIYADLMYFWASTFRLKFGCLVNCVPVCSIRPN
jgi:hypothetical protein